MEKYLVVGLGNPGDKYKKTRHNMGFDVIYQIAKEDNLVLKSFKNGVYAKDEKFGKEIYYLLPQTFMNLSGEAVGLYAHYFKIPQENIIVIFDDVDIVPGNIRISKARSNGGHNGIKSVDSYVKEYIKIRVGVGKSKYQNDLINHVINKVSDEEYQKLYEGVTLAKKALYAILDKGFAYAMNEYNKKQKTKEQLEKEAQRKLEREKRRQEYLAKKQLENKEKTMEKVYITGHKNPDTDTICSAIVAADLFKKAFNKDAIAIRQGQINAETKWVIETNKLELPELKTSLEEGEKVILVDHNNQPETIDNLENGKVEYVIDHHAPKIQLSYPTNIRIEPVGCTNTILYKMYKEHNIEITPQIAICMLSAIISDSLLFKSPTCTQEDIDVANELEKIAGVNKEEYGLEMLKAGTDLSEFTIKQRINLDAKTAVINGKKVTVAQIMTADIPQALEEKDLYKEEILKQIEEEELDLFMFLITDIINSNSKVIALGNQKGVVEAAYDVVLDDDMALLEGVVSRKKQVIPVISEKL